MLQQFVESFGGHWNHDPTLDQGYIGRSGSAIYVVHTEDVVSSYESEEIPLVRARLGQEPCALINIHIGHADSSESLAREFAQEFIKKWGGFVDDGEMLSALSVNRGK